MTNPPGGSPYGDPRGPSGNPQSGWSPPPPPVYGSGASTPNYGSGATTPNYAAGASAPFGSAPPPGGTPPVGSATAPTPPEKGKRRISLVLIVVIVLALIVSALLGTELWIRKVADDKGREATECVTRDGASVSIGASPPLLWQIVTSHYTNITIKTDGNQIKNAKGMKADIVVKDVKLKDTADSQGTIGSLDATITWTSDGIKQTIENEVPLVGNFITSVKTNPDKGTLELEAPLASITVKPTVTNGKLTLDMVALSGLGFTIPKETIEPAVESLTNLLSEELPLGIHADSAEVTDSGVVAKFSTTNATIPKESQDPCFASL